MQHKGLDVAQGYALPLSGSAQSIALFEAWRKIIRSHRLEREGMEGAPANLTPATLVNTNDQTQQPNNITRRAIFLNVGALTTLAHHK